jgi:hypothetical protein
MICPRPAFIDSTKVGQRCQGSANVQVLLARCLAAIMLSCLYFGNEVSISSAGVVYEEEAGVLDSFAKMRWPWLDTNFGVFDSIPGAFDSEIFETI